MKKLILLLIFILFIVVNTFADEDYPTYALAMHGSVKYPANFKNFDYVNPNAFKGGQIKLAAQGGFDSFNIFITKGESATGVGLIYDTLMVQSADEPFSMYCLLCESVTMPKDRSWVEFTIRDNANWHDGSPITAADVIFSLNILKEKGSPFYRFYYAGISEAKKLGEKKVRFMFDLEKFNPELPLIAGGLTVLPKHYWQKRDFTKTTLEPPLGSGAYKIKSFEANRQVTYERVNNYWGKDLPVMKGKYNFDTIRYDYYRDANVAQIAFTGGAYDVREENVSKLWATAYNTPARKKGVMRTEVIPNRRVNGMQGFVFNIRNELFKDPKVREALSLAFDFEWTNDVLFYGAYTRARSYFNNSELEATGLPTGKELALLEPFRDKLPAEVFNKEFNSPSTGGTNTGRRANLKKAMILLEEAGWYIADVEAGSGVKLRLVNNNYLDDNSKHIPFTFELMLASPMFERIALPYKGNLLNKLGIEISIRTIDTAQYINRVNSFDFDMMVGSWRQGLSPGNEQFNMWHSSAANSAGSRNWVGINSPVVDAMIEKIVSVKNREDLVVATRALDRVLQWGYYVVPHWYIGGDRIAWWDKFGRPDVVPTTGVDIFTWWADTEKLATFKARKDAVKSIEGSAKP